MASTQRVPIDGRPEGAPDRPHSAPVPYPDTGTSGRIPHRLNRRSCPVAQRAEYSRAPRPTVEPDSFGVRSTRPKWRVPQQHNGGHTDRTRYTPRSASLLRRRNAIRYSEDVLLFSPNPPSPLPHAHLPAGSYCSCRRWAGQCWGRGSPGKLYSLRDINPSHKFVYRCQIPQLIGDDTV